MLGSLTGPCLRSADALKQVWLDEFKNYHPTNNMTNILHELGKTAFPGITRFVASENFVINTSDDAIVKISYLGKNFPVWFMDKIENDIQPSTLSCLKLLKNANDKEIVDDAGGEKKVEVSLTEMFYLISKQPNGEVEILLRNGKVNFFYIRDISDVLRTIRLAGWWVGYSCNSPA